MTANEKEMTQIIESAIQRNNQALDICLKPLMDELNRRHKEIVEKEVKIRHLRREVETLTNLKDSLKEEVDALNFKIDGSEETWEDVSKNFRCLVEALGDLEDLNNIQTGYAQQQLRWLKSILLDEE